MEDEEIIELFFRRDETAIVRLGEKYGARCRRIARGITPNAEEPTRRQGCWSCIILTISDRGGSGRVCLLSVPGVRNKSRSFFINLFTLNTSFALRADARSRGCPACVYIYFNTRYP